MVTARDRRSQHPAVNRRCSMESLAAHAAVASAAASLLLTWPAVSVGATPVRKDFWLSGHDRR